MANENEWEEVAKHCREKTPEISGWDERAQKIQRAGLIADLVHLMGTSGSSAALGQLSSDDRKRYIEKISDLEYEAQKKLSERLDFNLGVPEGLVTKSVYDELTPDKKDLILIKMWVTRDSFSAFRSVEEFLIYVNDTYGRYITEKEWRGCVTQLKSVDI